MSRLSGEVIQFFQNQGVVIVSTLDKSGFPHSSCKGIVDISPNGKVYLLDLYRQGTFENLKRNRHISLTAVDEHKFRGYCLKGKAGIISSDKIRPSIIKAWEDKITGRLTRRVLKNIQDERGSAQHPEALLPRPEYLIVVDVEDVIDLTPYHLK